MLQYISKCALKGSVPQTVKSLKDFGNKKHSTTGTVPYQPVKNYNLGSGMHEKDRQSRCAYKWQFCWQKLGTISSSRVCLFGPKPPPSTHLKMQLQPQMWAPKRHSLYVSVSQIGCTLCRRKGACVMLKVLLTWQSSCLKLQYMHQLKLCEDFGSSLWTTVYAFNDVICRAAC